MDSPDRDLRRPYLLGVLSVGAGAAVCVGTDVAAGWATIAAVLVCCGVVVTGPPPAAAAAAVVAAAATTCFVVGEGVRHRLGGTDVQLAGSAAVTAAWYGWVAATPLVAAGAVRTRRARRRDAVRLRRLAVEQALAEQRLALARDLHDVVAHHVGGIAVLAQGAGTDSAKAPAVLPVIARESRLALDELRIVLDTLRSSTAPAAGSDLHSLIERMNAAGARISLHVDDDVPTYLTAPGPGPDQEAWPAVYRIVQEGVTNMLRHARPPTGVVSIRRDRDHLHVVMEDNGRRPPTPATTATNGHGHGLDGMRERVGALGGQLTAGPRADRGWRVEAILPLHRETSAPPGDTPPKATPR